MSIKIISAFIKGALKYRIVQYLIELLIRPQLSWSKKRFLDYNFRALEWCGYKLDKTPWNFTRKCYSYFLCSLMMAILLFLMALNVKDVINLISHGKVIRAVQGVPMIAYSILGVIVHLHFQVYKKKMDKLFIEIDEMVHLSVQISPRISQPWLDGYSFASNFLLVFCYLTNPPVAFANAVQIPLGYWIQHGAETNYSEIPMGFELHYGLHPRTSPALFWGVHALQMFQITYSLAYFSVVLSCYLSIVFFLVSMNEITSLYFKSFFMFNHDDSYARIDELIPFQRVLVLHQRVLHAMECYSEIISPLIFLAFFFAVLLLALSIFEIIMFGIDPQNLKSVINIVMALLMALCIMWFFQYLSEMTTEPHQILYFRPWYKMKHQKFLRELRFVMMRTTHKVKYTLGGLTTQASMETFLNLLKCAFTYSSFLIEGKRRMDMSEK